MVVVIATWVIVPVQVKQPCRVALHHGVLERVVCVQKPGVVVLYKPPVVVVCPQRVEPFRVELLPTEGRCWSSRNNVTPQTSMANGQTFWGHARPSTSGE